MTEFRHRAEALPLAPLAQIAYPEDHVRSVLEGVRIIAVVGFSANPMRPSHGIATFLKSQGYRVIPVNPGLAGQTFLGETVRASVSDIPGSVDLVDVFRRSEDAGATVDDAIAVADEKNIQAVWLQSGIRDDEAAKRAEAAGLKVVMNRCIMVEISRHGISP